MHPKIVYKEDCVDLRENLNLIAFNDQSTGKTRKKQKTKNSTFRLYNNEAKNNFQDILKSQSDFVTNLPHLKSSQHRVKKEIRASSPKIPRSLEHNQHSYIIEPFKTKFTMTKDDKTLNKSVKKILDRKPPWNDQRLKEKYSILKVPWNKRSYTVPVIDTSKISLSLKDSYSNKFKQVGKKKIWQAYHYDDGSDIDSNIVQNQNISPRYLGTFALQSQLLTLLNCMVYLCGFLIACLILWFLSSGNKILIKMLRPKPPENLFKQYIKYFTGMAFYTLDSILSLIMGVFGIPTQQVYHSPTDTWPPQMY